MQQPSSAAGGGWSTTAANVAWSLRPLALSEETAWEAELGHLRVHLVGVGAQMP